MLLEGRFSLSFLWNLKRIESVYQCISIPDLTFHQEPISHKTESYQICGLFISAHLGHGSQPKSAEGAGDETG